MSLSVLYSLPVWMTGVALVVVLVIATEVGHWAGQKRAKKRGEKEGPDFGAIQAAVLGLLGLLLAFTYSFAATRADNRKQFVVEEANALGTAYLRADLTDEPDRGELRAALRDYLETRIVPDEVNRDPEQAAAVIAESERVQARLWPLAVRVGRDGSPTAVDALVVSSINDVLDAHTRRVAGSRDRVPDVILWMLFAVAVMSLTLTGFASGSAKRRNVVSTTILVVLVAIVVMLIVDMDHPRSGMIRVSQRPLLDLQSQWAAEGDARRAP